MKSIQHVLWRGALALGLMVVGLGSGLGSGLGMPGTGGTAATDCRITPQVSLAGQRHPGLARGCAVLVVLPPPRKTTG